MSDFIQAVKGTALSVAEFFTPVLKQSKFRQTGAITPEEFVAAGDHLVHQCPSWAWCPVSDQGTTKPYLPKDKQYLITKSVPCYKRCKDIEYVNIEEKIVLTENDEEGWVDTHYGETPTAISDMTDAMTLTDKQSVPQLTSELSKGNSSQEEDDGEAEDMDKFMNMVEDEDSVSIRAATRKATCLFLFIRH